VFILNRPHYAEAIWTQKDNYPNLLPQKERREIEKHKEEATYDDDEDDDDEEDDDDDKVADNDEEGTDNKEEKEANPWKGTIPYTLQC
jgi:hypothetical protein